MTSRAPSAAAGPLSGLTVVECASVVAGPLAAQYLGDMGADVIKVEPPAGDLTRVVGPRRSEGLLPYQTSCAIPQPIVKLA